jgi:hypothetical protein
MHTKLMLSLLCSVVGWLACDRAAQLLKPATPLPKYLPAQVLTPSSRVPELLEQQVSWDFHEKPLSEVALDIARELQLPVKIDEKALIDAAIGTDTLIEFHMVNIPAGQALELMLRDHALAWVMLGDCVWITTQEQYDNNSEYREQRVYIVSDLGQFADDKGEFVAYDELCEAIVGSVEPYTWRESGGDASVVPVRAAGAIVVECNRGVHQKVAQLLETLREARRLQAMTGATKVRETAKKAPAVSLETGCGKGFTGGCCF